MHRIAVLDDYQGVASDFADWSSLPEPAEVVAFADSVRDEDALVARLAPFDVLVAMRERTAFPRSVLERLPNLRLLVTTGARNASIDLAAAADCGVTVCGTGAHPSGPVELTWALILATARHLTQEDAAVRAGAWQQTVGTDLAGATLGVVGLGRLGEQVARIGQAFGMDVVTVHLVLSDRTRGLIGRDELAAMKRTAILINTSRGPIVDEAALIDALRDGTIAGAGLDVFDQEPLPPEHPLRSVPRAVLTPHLGYVTAATYEVFYRDAVEDVAAFLAGAPIRELT